MRFSIKLKVMGLVTVFGLFVVGLVTSLAVANIYARGERRIAAYREALLEERKEQLRNYVGMAVNVIINQPREEAKKTIKTMAAIRLDNGENPKMETGKSTWNTINELCDIVRETSFAIHGYLRSGHLERFTRML